MRDKSILVLAMLVVIALLAAACGGSRPPAAATTQPTSTGGTPASLTPPPVPTNTAEPTPASPASPLSPLSPPATPRGSSAGVLPEGGAITAARAFLAEKQGLTPAQVEVVSTEPVMWPDACLGVSVPGMMCAQVITPGYRITLTTPQGTFEIHTDATGSAVRLASPQK